MTRALKILTAAPKLLSPDSVDNEELTLNFKAQCKSFKSLAIVGPLLDAKIQIHTATIYVDAGVHFFNSQGFPSISIGDEDSAQIPLDLKFPARKDESDLALALKLIPQHIREIDLYGFWGERRDHEWAVLGEVQKTFTLVAGLREVRLWNRNSALAAVALNAGLSIKQIRGLFSLFTWNPQKLELAGECEYSFNGWLPAFSSQGLSNLGRGEVRFQAEQPLLIFLGEDASD